MSLKETEFPALLLKLKDLSDFYNNPQLVQKVVSEVYKNYKFIPLYPGIINDTLNRMIKNININEIKINDWITFEVNNIKYAGYVSKIENNRIEIRNVTKLEFINKIEILKSEVTNILKVNENQLKEDWPMLIFEEENENS